MGAAGRATVVSGFAAPAVRAGAAAVFVAALESRFVAEA
jgi:hypothetical protein